MKGDEVMKGLIVAALFSWGVKWLIQFAPDLREFPPFSIPSMVLGSIINCLMIGGIVLMGLYLEDKLRR